MEKATAFPLFFFLPPPSLPKPLRDIAYMNGERVAMRLYGSQAGWYYFVNDHLGTPRKVVDSSGSVVWQAAYLPFGKAQVLSGSSVTNNFRFPGQYYDEETELHYNWNRYYMPAKGRYLTADPIGLEGGINLYAYVAGNPTNLTDPRGLSTTMDVLTGIGWILATFEPTIVGEAVMTYITMVRAGIAAAKAAEMLSENYDEKGKKNVCSGSGESSPGTPDPDDDDRIRAGHAKDRHPEWNNHSVDDLVGLMRDVRENGTAHRAGNGNVLYRRGNIIMIENKFAPNRGTIFIRNESPRSIRAYIDQYIWRNR